MGEPFLTPEEEHARNLGRVDLDPQSFDNLVLQRGLKVIWEKSILCSCIGEDGQVDFSCPFCRGRGFQYFDPIHTRVMAMSMIGGKDSIPVGLMDVGSSLMTSLSYNKVGFRDRITFLDMSTSYSQVLTFEGEEVRLKYSPNNVIAVRVQNIEISKDDYSTNGDFLVFKEGVMDFGTRFSILMTIPPTYVVVDMPHELRGTYRRFNEKQETFYDLPRQYMIKREDLLGLSRGELV